MSDGRDPDPGTPAVPGSGTSGRILACDMPTLRPVHYLDHAATTPMRPAAVAAYAEAASVVGNASSLHGSGRRARRRVEEARESLAHHLGCRPSEVVFTSGGTESDNLAILGQAAAHDGDLVAVGATEHHSVLDAAAHLATARGGSKEIRLLPVDAHGAVVPDTVRELGEEAGPRLALVATMLANNEIGTLGDVAAVAGHARAAPTPASADDGGSGLGECVRQADVEHLVQAEHRQHKGQAGTERPFLTARAGWLATDRFGRVESQMPAVEDRNGKQI